MVKNNSYLIKKYNLIIRKHPRVDLNPIDKVNEYVKNYKKVAKKSIRIKEIATALKMKIGKVGRCLNVYLVPYGYRFVAKGDNSKHFFLKEDSNGNVKTLWVWHKIQALTKKELKRVIVELKTNLSSLIKKLKKDYGDVVSSINSSKPNLVAYNRLVDYLWKKGKKSFFKLSWSNTANRYS